MAALVSARPAEAQATAGWQSGVRQRVAAQDLTGALTLAEARLAESSDDLEARGWRARILGWLGRWAEAERDYRLVLERAPRDVDILVGLGRTLRALDRPVEARAAFRAALAVDPKNAEAEQGLASVREAPRHQLSVNADTDRFNYTPQGAQAYAATVRSDWTRRWTSTLGARFNHRSGVSAGRWSGALTARLPARSALTVGGSFGRDNGIVSAGEIFADVGHGFTFDRNGFIRGVEANLQARRLWFDAAHVVTVAPGAIVYLPRDWMLSIVVTGGPQQFSRRRRRVASLERHATHLPRRRRGDGPPLLRGRHRELRARGPDRPLLGEDRRRRRTRPASGRTRGHRVPGLPGSHAGTLADERRVWVCRPLLAGFRTSGPRASWSRRSC